MVPKVFESLKFYCSSLEIFFNFADVNLVIFGAVRFSVNGYTSKYHYCDIEAIAVLQYGANLTGKNLLPEGRNSFRPRGYKTFYMLNSVEHEILNALKLKSIKKFGCFWAQINLECYFSRS